MKWKHAVVYSCIQKYFYCWQDFPYKSVSIWIIKKNKKSSMNCPTIKIFETDQKLKWGKIIYKLELVKLTQSTVLVHWSLLTVFQYYMSKKSSMVLSYRSTGQLPTCHHDNTCTALTPIMDKDHRRNEYQSIHLGRISQILPGTEDSEGTEDKQDSGAGEKMKEGEKLRVALPENYLQPLEAKALVHLSQKMGSTPRTHLKGKYRCMLITGYKRNT